MQPVIIRRWELAAAFVVLTVVFTIVGAWAHNGATTAHRAAVRAEMLATQNKRIVGIIVANRRLTVDRIHKEQVRSCQSRHKLYVVLDSTVRRSIGSQRALLKTAVIQASPDLLRIERAGIANSLQTLHDLRGADCHGVPSLEVKPKHVKP